jgi:hypothetical protein
MRILLTVLMVSCLFFYFACKSDPEQKSKAIVENSRALPEITRILFIGNSHTNRNDIPKTIQLMAQSAGDSTYSHNETQPGYTLAQHCAREETLRTIDSLKWDFVVLQEQGGLQALPVPLIDTGVCQYTQKLIDAIKRNSSNTKIILYMTHAYRNGVLTFGGNDWAASDPLVATYSGMQNRIRENLINMSERFDVELSPAGVLWKLFQDRYPSVNLFDTDGIHPLPNGSYLLACAIYSTIYRKSPAGKYVPDGVNSDEAGNMQRIAYESLFKLNPDWTVYK